MNVLDAIVSRRSTRVYKPIPVEREKVEKILDAGRYAPSGGNNQTAHFLVIQKKDVLEKLVTLVQEAFAKMEVCEGMYKSIRNSILQSKTGNYVFHYRAPVLIVVANQKDYGNNMADTACAIENMMLEANELDLGSCWINQVHWLTDNPVICEYLASVAIGYPETPDGLPLRKPLDRKGNEVTWIL